MGKIGIGKHWNNCKKMVELGKSGKSPAVTGDYQHCKIFPVKIVR